MEIFLLWLGLAAIVGVAANTRGRSGAGWFLLGVVLSPLIAGLLLLALPRLTTEPAKPRQPAWVSTSTVQRVAAPQPQQTAFTADGVYAGIPYRVIDSGAIEAMMAGGLVRFKSMDQFIAAATGKSSWEHPE